MSPVEWCRFAVFAAVVLVVALWLTGCSSLSSAGSDFCKGTAAALSKMCNPKEQS